MKNEVFIYDIKDLGQTSLFGISVPHRRILYSLKNPVFLVPEGFEGTMMKSQLDLIQKFSELVKSQSITKSLAEELLDLIEVYGDDRSSVATDESQIERDF